LIAIERQLGQTRDMSLRTLPVVALVALAALSCETGPAVPTNDARVSDASVDAGEACARLIERWNDLVAHIPAHTCSAGDECSYVGGPIEPTCDCVAALPLAAVYRGSLTGDIGAQLAAVERQYRDSCAGYMRICDVAPPEVGCSQDGHCYVSDRSCPVPPDASVDAAVDAAVDAP